MGVQAPRSRAWMRRSMLLGVGLVAAGGGTLGFIYSGLYDIAATRQHTAPVYWALITTLRQSIHAHAAREIGPAPDLSDPALAELGLRLYERHCVQCHGAPGVPPGPVGLGLTPPPSNLVPAGRDWAAQEIFWTIRHGLKMTGMPAWEYRLTDGEMWAITAFVRAMAVMTPQDYRNERARLMPAHDSIGGGP